VLLGTVQFEDATDKLDEHTGKNPPTRSDSFQPFEF